MEVVSTDSYSYGIACVRCNYTLIAPNWSEYVSEHQVRHSWSCENCGHQFETLDDVQVSASTKTPPQDSDVACRIKGKSHYKIRSPGLSAGAPFMPRQSSGGWEWTSATLPTIDRDA